MVLQIRQISSRFVCAFKSEHSGPLDLFWIELKTVFLQDDIFITTYYLQEKNTLIHCFNSFIVKYTS